MSKLPVCGSKAKFLKLGLLTESSVIEIIQFIPMEQFNRIERSEFRIESKFGRMLTLEVVVSRLYTLYPF